MTEYGDFSFDPETRIIRGLLLPFDETSRKSKSGHIARFAAEDVDLPRDISIVSLNRHHNPHDPIGRAIKLEKVSEPRAGVYAEYMLADTEEADEWMSAQRETLRKLSPEVVFAADGKRAKITGSAVVTEGAFASAGLFAIGEDPEDPQDEEVQEPTSEPVQETEPETDPAPETPEAETPNKEEVVTEATLPEGVTSPAGAIEKPATAAGLFAAITNRDADALAQFATQDNANALFAIAGIQESGPAGRTIGADTTAPQFLGELWTQQPYQRKFVPLFNQRPLTSYRVAGWRWTVKPEVGPYAGNLTEVPSNAVDTEPVSAEARRIAGGHRIDRRFVDFNDNTVIESYFRLMAESYARVSDADILAAAVTAAGTATNIVPKTGVGAGITGIIQGALKVIASGNTPSFAVVAPSVYEDVLYTVENAGLKFLDQSFGLEEGSMAGFRIVPGEVGTDNVLVGSKNAIDVFELPGSPIRVEGIEPHHGAIDPALYGYLAHIVNNAGALALMHTTPAA